MRNFLTFIKEFRIPSKKELIEARESLTGRRRRIWVILLTVSFVTMVVLVAKVNSSFMTNVPAEGGTTTEGIIGMPTLINPVLALSDADKDVTSIVYSGLMRKNSDGTFIPDLAESYTVSSDGMTYTFILKQNIKFHDGTAITSDDVIFTIEKIKDPLIKSPRRIGWDGVDVSKTDDRTIVFSLKQAYISFIDNTTIGILPMHIWKNVSAVEFGLSPLNIKAVGSGPYQIDSVKRNSEGVPEKYTLKRFTGFILGIPNIKYINLVSYANEKDLVEALTNHSIDQASGMSPDNALEIEKAGYIIHTATLPRIFGLFFNSANNKVLADSSVIQALDKALDRQELVEKILDGYGTTVHSPIPQSIAKDQNYDIYKTANLDEASAILEKGGWKIGDDGIRAKGGTTTVTQTKKVGKKTVTQKVVVNNGPVMRLTFSLTTGDTPELKEAASLAKEQLEKLGAQIEIKVYEPGPLNQLIRGREYEALFFGQIINHESDLYSFWHSTQKTDPGLNIAMYGNKNVDTILESAQKTLDPINRSNKYNSFITEFNKDLPALLVYSPKYLYATLPKLDNIKLNILTAPSDRFASIYNWYAETDHVWKIFTK